MLSFPKKRFSDSSLLDERDVFRHADGHFQVPCQRRERRIVRNPSLLEKPGQNGLKMPGQKPERE